MAQVKGFSCPSCGSAEVAVATNAIYFVYLRCSACSGVWSIEMSEFRRRSESNEGRSVPGDTADGSDWTPKGS